MTDLIQSLAIVLGGVTSIMLGGALCRANARITKLEMARWKRGHDADRTLEKVRLQSALDQLAAKIFPTDWAAETKAVKSAITEWPRLPDGAEFIPSPVDPGGVMLVLTPQGLLNLRVDRAGRLSSTGFPLSLQRPEAGRGAHEE